MICYNPIETEQRNHLFLCHDTSKDDRPRYMNELCFSYNILPNNEKNIDDINFFFASIRWSITIPKGVCGQDDVENVPINTALVEMIEEEEKSGYCDSFISNVFENFFDPINKRFQIKVYQFMKFSNRPNIDRVYTIEGDLINEEIFDGRYSYDDLTFVASKMSYQKKSRQLSLPF
ncbi:hypothetical protein ACFL1H_03805 [Nanoarchaeota archaeon]